MFGTLYLPGQEREKLTFGFENHSDAHTVKVELVAPLINAARHIWPKRTEQISAITVAEREQS
jgi:hypothetical protein